MSFSISNLVANSTISNPTDLKVAMQLADIAGNDGTCYPGITYIRIHTRLSESTIKRAIARLIKDGHLAKQKRAHKSNFYKLTPIPCPLRTEFSSGIPSRERKEEIRNLILGEIITTSLAEEEQGIAESNGSICTITDGDKVTGHFDPLREVKLTPRKRSICTTNLSVEQSVEPLGKEADASPLPSVPAKAGKKKTEITLTEYIANCQENDLEVVPENHYVWDKAEAIGLTVPMVNLEWAVFKDKYTSGAKTKSKKYADWLQTFANAVTNGWHKLYYIQADGQVILTSTGRAAAKLHGVQL
ncbi:helix-turn-helix domain-containing protein [Limnobacter sp.]|uniref:helix-turn-helix domain-containing protein n=1 Tax=Limnobacter sp. TaxID=2003368 RepID=UPI00311DC059